MIKSYSSIVEKHIDRLAEDGKHVDADDVAIELQQDIALVCKVCSEKLQAGVIKEWTKWRRVKCTYKYYAGQLITEVWKGVRK